MSDRSRCSVPRSGVARGSWTPAHLGQIAIACTAENLSIQFLISRVSGRDVAAGGRPFWARESSYQVENEGMILSLNLV